LLFLLSLVGAACVSSGGQSTDAGPAGSPGNAGSSGSPGSAGTTGGAGSSGSSGSAGTTGGAGSSGSSGSAGTTASAGSSATAGTTGRDGGAVDAVTTTDAAPGKCTHLLCESFEDTAVGQIPTGWTRQLQQGADSSMVGVDDKEAARGKHALKMGAIPIGPRRIVHSATSFGAAHWGRIFYKVQLPAPKPSTYLHSTMVAFVGTNPQGSGTEEVRVVDTVQDPNGKHQFLYNVQPNGAEFGTESKYDYMYDGAWHCAEWHIDATNQSYHFYFDGNEITQIAKMNGAGNLSGTGIPQMFQSIEVGWINYQNAPPGFVAWMDELAIDNTRIGCAN
jgi:hypothetical protein